MSLIVKGPLPLSLNNKRIILNGPVLRRTGERATEFDGRGFITSVVFRNNNAMVSDVQLPNDNSIVFPLSDYLERDYMKILSKLPYVFLGNRFVQSGTRNTAVQKYKGNYYAVEETCRPIKLAYDEFDRIQVVGKSLSIGRMAAHLIDNSTIFSYTILDKYPLKFNNTLTIPWSPFKQPLLVHDGVGTHDGKMFVFPITSTGMGRVNEYLNHDIELPFDGNLNKAGWLIYDKEQHACFEILMNEYTDLFHIAHIEHLFANVHRLYVPFVYNFSKWMNDNTTQLDIRLKLVTLDLTKRTIVDYFDTKIRMDFVNKYENLLIGSSLTDNDPKAVMYNMDTRTYRELALPGEIIREIIPYDSMLMYFSHEDKNTKTFLYIVSMDTAEIITKVAVPNRPPGFHTTFFED